MSAINMIVVGVILGAFGAWVIFKREAKGTNEMGDTTFEFSGTGAIVFGVFMLIIGLGLIIYGLVA